MSLQCQGLDLLRGFVTPNFDTMATKLWQLRPRGGIRFRAGKVLPKLSPDTSPMKPPCRKRDDHSDEQRN